MPVKSVLDVAVVLAAVIAPMVLFWQSTTSVLEMFMPINPAFALFEVYVMDAVPVAPPIVLPVTVPMLATVAPER